MERAAPIVGAGAAAVCAAVLAFFLLGLLDNRETPAIIIRDPLPDATIVVSVEGAVASPAAYALPGTARVHDAIEAAGGLSGSADAGALNMAARLRDEERLIVPAKRDEPRPTEPAAGGDAERQGLSSAEPVGTSSQLININTASTVELEQLPGIGPALAAAIIESREQDGPFATVDDLARVPGISERMVDEMRTLITVSS